MNNIKFLLLGTSLSFIPTITFAQCVATQDCATLGYTETSCNGGKGVKCPFGNKWACLTSDSEIEQQFCDKYGFKYTCSGTGYSGGSGTACGGKYVACTCASKYNWSGSACKSCGSSYKYTCTGTNQTSGVGTACGGYYTQCNCTSGYEWKDGSCQKQLLCGAQGELYYCNGTVIGIKASGMNFYVTMQDLGQMDWNYANSQYSSYALCGNIKGALPTKDQLKTIYNNKSLINSLLSTNGGTQLTNAYYWSSTYNGDGTTNSIVDMSNGYVDRGYFRDNYYVRPVLTSW